MRRTDDGTALVEFVWLSLVLLVPLLYVLLAVFEVQRTRRRIGRTGRRRGLAGGRRQGAGDKARGIDCKRGEIGRVGGLKAVDERHLLIEGVSGELGFAVRAGRTPCDLNQQIGAVRGERGQFTHGLGALLEGQHRAGGLGVTGNG